MPGNSISIYLLFLTVVLIQTVVAVVNMPVVLRLLIVIVSLLEHLLIFCRSMIVVADKNTTLMREW